MSHFLQIELRLLCGDLIVYEKVVHPVFIVIFALNYLIVHFYQRTLQSHIIDTVNIQILVIMVSINKFYSYKFYSAEKCEPLSSA